MGYETFIEALTDEQKNSILHDLWVCLAHGRLLDSTTGWENYEGVAARPATSGASGFRSAAAQPRWESLEAFRPFYIRFAAGNVVEDDFGKLFGETE